MSLGSLLDFEKFHGKQILKDIAHKPTRLLTGVDPASTGLWNKVLSTDDKPIVDQMGGATQDRYREAQAAGIDTKTGKRAQNIAHVVAAIFGAKGLAGIGGGASSAGGGAAPAEASASAGGKSFGLGDMQAWNASMPQAEQSQRPLADDHYEAPRIDDYLRGATVASSRALKDPGGKGLGDAVRRGLAGEDPIDANGVEVIAIKALDKRINEFTRRVQALVQRKGAGQ